MKFRKIKKYLKRGFELISKNYMLYAEKDFYTAIGVDYDGEAFDFNVLNNRNLKYFLKANKIIELKRG